jgi:hypothetical protein
MKKTRRMYRLRKLGLFIFLKLPAAPPKKKATTPTPKPKYRTERKPTLFYEKGDLNVIEAKQQSATEDPAPIDCQMPDPAEGWSTTRPDSDELYISAVKVVRQPSGEFTKYFKVLVRPEVLLARAKQMELERIEKEKQEALEYEAKQKELSREAKRKRAKLRRKLREIDHSIAKAATQEARLTLFLMGKY